MTLNKILEEVNNRINYLESKKDKLNVLQITQQEIQIRKEEINKELDKLYLLKHYGI